MANLKFVIATGRGNLAQVFIRWSLGRKAIKMKIKTLIAVAIAAAAMTNQAHAQIGWTLDQCQAKYGTADKDNGQFQSLGIKRTRPEATPYGETYFFNVSGFTLAIAFARGAAVAIDYDSEFALTPKQAKEILAKNSNTTWKKDTENSDEEADSLTTTTKSKHDLEASLYFYPKADHNSIAYIVIVDNTVITQINKEDNAADQQKKANEAQKTQGDVNGL